MRKPPEPPNWFEYLEGDALQRITSPEVSDFVRRANDAYLHWDRVRYHELPPSIKPEEAWAAIKLSRSPQLRQLPLSLYATAQNMRYWSPPKHLQWLHEIDQKAGGTIGTMSGQAIPDDNERYLFNSLMEEAIASSRLEGASSTREKAKRMLRTKRKPRNRSEQMIMNNYRAILEIRDLKKEALTPRMLLHLQSILTTDTQDDPDDVGKFRENNNVQVVESLTDEVMHDPPDWKSIPDRLVQLCDFANKNEGAFIHPVIKAIVLHFAIGFIHPFADGNGRTARAVFYWYMLKQGYWLFEYLPLSRILITGPAQYERGYLYAEQDSGDVTYFIHFHLRIICKAIKALHKYIEEQVKSVREASRIVELFPELNYRQTALLQDCLKHPGRQYTIRQHLGTHRIAYATARSDLYGLSHRGLLLKDAEGQRAVFTAPENLLARIKNTPKASLRSRVELESPESSDESDEGYGSERTRSLFDDE